MDSATATSVETDTGTASLRRIGAVDETNGKATSSNGQINGEKKTFAFKKYRHITAVHSESRPSTLSHDARAPPSFLGFRNLMVIVLGITP